MIAIATVLHNIPQICGSIYREAIADSKNFQLFALIYFRHIAGVFVVKLLCFLLCQSTGIQPDLIHGAIHRTGTTALPLVVTANGECIYTQKAHQTIVPMTILCSCDLLTVNIHFNDTAVSFCCHCINQMCPLVYIA